MNDGRVSAWIHAWRHLEAAQKLQVDHNFSQTPGAFHQVLLDQAQIYSDLAGAQDEVGLAAAEFLAYEERQRVESKKRMDEFLKENKDG